MCICLSATLITIRRKEKFYCSNWNTKTTKNLETKLDTGKNETFIINNWNKYRKMFIHLSVKFCSLRIYWFRNKKSLDVPEHQIGMSRHNLFHCNWILFCNFFQFWTATQWNGIRILIAIQNLYKFEDSFFHNTSITGIPICNLFHSLQNSVTKVFLSSNQLFELTHIFVRKKRKK